MPRPIRRKRRASSATWAVLAAVLAACGTTDAPPVVEGVIDRESFIQVYVDLRDAAVRSPGLTISDEARRDVLTRHGVEEDDLLAFVEAYGRDLDYMNELWAEIERRIEALPPVPRALGGSGA